LTRLRHLVVVIPGIGGSVLAEPRSDAHDARGRVRYDLSVRGLAGPLLSPGRLDLESYPDLVPVDLVSDFTALPPLVTLPGYQRLVQDLRNSFDRVVVDTYRPPAPVHPDTDVLLFPYDFRRSVADAAQRLDDAVEEAVRSRPETGERPVVVVAHSMGGLVARYWIAVLSGWRRCHALLTLGTPHRGAPKALDWLVNGAGAGPLRYSRATRVIRDWPSVYELLPQYEAVWDQAVAGGAGRATELMELPPELVTARPGLAEYAGQFAALATRARQVHQEIADGLQALDPCQAPRLTAFMGRGHPTPNRVILADGRLRVTKDDPPWRGNAGWRGDGTVPMLSAIPREQGDLEELWRVLPDRHGQLGSVPEPVKLLGLYAGDRVPVRGGPMPDRPWLGLDVEDFAAAGADIPVGVQMLPEPTPGDVASVAIEQVDGSPGVPVTSRLHRLEPGSAAWHGSVPGLPPGRYELTAEVDGVPTYGRVSAATALVILDGIEEGEA
jgi:hypothetical protein